MQKLYDHRAILFISFCILLKSSLYGKSFHIWRSKNHNDGTKMEDGFFVCGINDIISYHLEDKFWQLCVFMQSEDKSLWDGHTEDDVFNILFSCCKSNLFEQKLSFETRFKTYKK